MKLLAGRGHGGSAILGHLASSWGRCVAVHVCHLRFRCAVTLACLLVPGVSDPSGRGWVTFTDEELTFPRADG